MAATPQITLRVPRETRDRWKKVAEGQNTNVSEVLRQLMTEWVDEQDER